MLLRFGFLLLTTWFFGAAAFAVEPYDVKCAKENECPGFIAGLSNAHGVCSTFLVADDIMATNLHCIPESLRQENASCKGKIRVFFPKTPDHPKETAECETILYISPPLIPDVLTPDFAFFKLSKPAGRPHLDLSQNGIADMSEMTVYKVDPSNEKSEGMVRKVVCTAIQNSLLNPYFTSEKSPLFSLIPCHTIKGNSGSPILSADGKVRGILSAVSISPLITADPSVKTGMAKGVATLGSNFACLNTFFLGFNRGDPPDCQVKMDEKTRQEMMVKLSTKTLAEAQVDLERRLNATVAKMSLQTKSSFRWKLKQRDATDEERTKNILGKFEIEPSCLIPWPGNPEKLQARLKKSEVTLPLSWTKYAITLGHDNYYRPKAKIDEDPVAASFVFTPADLLKESDISARIEKAPVVKADGSKEPPVVLNKYTLDRCGR